MNQPSSRSRKKRSPLLGLFLLVLILGAIGWGGFSLWWNNQKAPVNPSDTNLQAFVIVEGDSLSTVAKKLEEGKLIRSSLVFKKTAQDRGKLVSIEPGTVKISPAMGVDEIIDSLGQGVVDKWVTLLEGWRVEQMAKVISEKLGIEEKVFVEAAKAYEGHLFPDTYLFNHKAKAEDIISTLRNTFDKKYSDEIIQKIKKLGLTADQGVILASIVEREARSDKVRTEVAGVLLKRFKMGMGLNADATVQYAKDSQKLKSGNLEKFWQPVLQSDYQDVVSPYNTYIHVGFPPAPIANPSLSSLNAVANADPNTPYVYYYHDSQGNTYYARTLDEHNINVANHR